MKLPKHFNEKPGRILMDVTFTVDGGDIRDEVIAAIRLAVVGVFDVRARELGVQSFRVVKSKSTAKRQLERTLHSHGFGFRPTQPANAEAPR